MRQLAGKTAFVTGGASGIGLALGAAFAQAGMKVMLADIETEVLAEAVKSLHDFAPNVRGVPCDVADPLSVEHAAKACYEFGNVHVVSTMPVWPPPAASTISRSTTGDGCSTSI
jgi:NAD(P)-dependent dehydrogenase (short-subunit alcohol dehydrogenase family)